MHILVIYSLLIAGHNTLETEKRLQLPLVMLLLRFQMSCLRLWNHELFTERVCVSPSAWFVSRFLPRLLPLHCLLFVVLGWVSVALCDIGYNILVAFYCPQHKVQLCNDHAV